METVIAQTGADKAAAALAQKLHAAGWDVRTAQTDTEPTTFHDGTPMHPAFRQASVHVDGPACLRTPSLAVFWYSDLPTDGFKPRPDRFDGEIRVGGVDLEFSSQAEMAAWVDCLLAIAAAVQA